MKRRIIYDKIFIFDDKKCFLSAYNSILFIKNKNNSAYCITSTSTIILNGPKIYFIYGN
jgi:hypothetical protein